MTHCQAHDHLLVGRALIATTARIAADPRALDSCPSDSGPEYRVQRLRWQELAIKTDTRKSKMTALACWLAYSAFFLVWLDRTSTDETLFLPVSVALAWLGLGVGLAMTPRYHSFGVGIVAGVAVAVLTSSIYTVIGLAALADEIGPDAVEPAAGSLAVST